MNSIPLEAQPFAIAAAILGIGAVILSIRCSIVSRAFAVLKQNCNDLEAHLLRAQRDLAMGRDEAAEWRMQMQKQFDAFRAASTGQLTMAEARFERVQGQFDDASKAAAKTQLELHTQLEVLRGMCAELPFAKMRILELERSLTAAPVAIQREAKPAQPELHEDLEVMHDECAELPFALPAVAETEPSLAIAPAADEPKLNGANGHAITLAEIPALPEFDETRHADLESQLAVAAQRNAALQRELITLRVRSGKAAATVKPKRARM